MKYRCVLLVLITLFGSSAGAAPAGVKIVGFGSASCGTWVAQRHMQSGYRAQLEAWVLGYLSGWAVSKFPEKNVLLETDIDGLLTWLDNYCAAHPLDSLVTGMFDLEDELIRRTSN